MNTDMVWLVGPNSGPTMDGKSPQSPDQSGFAGPTSLKPALPRVSLTPAGLMPLLQNFRLLPAALALLTQLAIDANQSASRTYLSITGTGQFGAEEQVTSISQFSDVQPTDWVC